MILYLKKLGNCVYSLQNDIKKDLKDLKLLFVEDDTMNREIMQEILQEYFLEVIVAKDGKEGLEMFKNNQVDVIFTDISIDNRR